MTLVICPTGAIVHKNLKKTASSCNVFGNFYPPSCDHRQPSIHESIFPKSKKRDFLLVPVSSARNSGGLPGDHQGAEDPRALETVLKLYTAIKNKNIRELSEIIGDECQCVCNLFSVIQPLRGKKQVMDFFSYLIRSLGSNIEFVITPTLHHGMNVGVQWSLEWNKTHVPLGKGFSFHICQIYKGKVIIRNVEMFMEPLLRIEPLRLKIMGIMAGLMEKMGSNSMFKGKANGILWLHFRPPCGKGGIDPKHGVASLGQPLTADIACDGTQHFLSD
ncbi:hypothetical protein ACFX2C_005371 [Malus domestica]